MGQITSVVLTWKFKTDRFKIPLLGEAEIAFRLGIKSWWGFTLAQVTPYWIFMFNI